MTVLQGITVLDLGYGRGASYCTRLMAGFGARVIKVETPGTGNPARHSGPFAGGEAGVERSLPFHWLNAGKESVCIDLEHAQGRSLLERLMDRMDVIVDDRPARTRAATGPEYEAASATRPRLVMTTISGFGAGGDCENYELDEIVLYAMSGCMAATGDADRPPLASGPAVAGYTTAMHAYLGTLMAIFQRNNTGRGSHVEISMRESTMENMELHLANYLHQGRAGKRNGDDHPGVPWRTYSCRDGYATVIGAPMRHWPRGAKIFDEPRLLEKRFRHISGRIEHRREVEALMRPWLEAHDRREIYEAGQARGLAFGYVATVPEASASRQLRERNFFTDSDPHPEVGTLRVMGAPYRLSCGHWRAGRGPLLGEHTDDVLANNLGLSREEIDGLRRAGAI